MAIQFPSNPAPGDIYGNWQYNGSAWGPIPGGGPYYQPGEGLVIDDSTAPLPSVSLAVPVDIDCGGTGATDPVQALQNLNGLSLAGGTATGELCAPYIRARNAGGTQSIQMVAGLIGFYNHDGARVGYIGNSDTDMQIVAELAGSTFHVQGRATFNGNSLLIHGTRPVLGLWDEGAGLYGMWSDAGQLRIGQIDGNVTPQGALVTIDGTGVMTATAPALADSSNKLVTSAWVKGQNYGAGGGSVNITAGTGITVSPSPLTGTGTVALSTPVAISAGGTNATTAGAGADNLHGFSGATAGLVRRTGAATYALDSATYLTGNQTVTLSGDITGSGTTAITATLATVNANVGTFQGITVNAKGLITGATNQAYAPLASPTFTGTPSLPTGTTGVTQAAATNNTSLATTAYVQSQFPLSIAKGGSGQTTAGAAFNALAASGGAVGGNLAISTTGSSPLTVTCASGGFARMTCTVTGTRTWTVGAWADGTFEISDETAPAARIIIGTDGACSNKTGTWFSISDARLKSADSIKPYEHGLAEVAALRPQWFRYNGEGGTEEDGVPHFGLIAQEVAPYLPELVGERTYDGERYLTLDPGRLVYALVNAIKTLDERLTAAEAQLTSQGIKP